MKNENEKLPQTAQPSTTKRSSIIISTCTAQDRLKRPFVAVLLVVFVIMVGCFYQFFSVLSGSFGWLCK
jgi:hypothetical protein